MMFYFMSWNSYNMVAYFCDRGKMLNNPINDGTGAIYTVILAKT